MDILKPSRRELLTTVALLPFLGGSGADKVLAHEVEEVSDMPVIEDDDLASADANPDWGEYGPGY